MDSATTNTTYPPPPAPALWHPTAPERTRMWAFMQRVNREHRQSISSYQQLYQWSVDNPSTFWRMMWHELQVVAQPTYLSVLADSHRPMDALPWRWFPEARLNYTENIFAKYHNDDQLAIIAETERSAHTPHAAERVTYHQLHERVRRCHAALVKAGIRQGDRVVGYMPNSVETVVMFLAVAAAGAVWSVASPDFGPNGVRDRFAQIQPRLLVSVNAVVYNGKVHPHLDKVRELVGGLPTVERVVIVPFVSDVETKVDGDGGRWSLWADFLQTAGDALPAEIPYTRVPFDHPLYILYSSGTTGQPKCIMHGHGGPLLQHFKEHALHGDMRKEDVFFQYTTTGWMMWQWLVGGLTLGCTIVVYDGSPFKPDASTLWHLAAKHRFTKFGTSAKYLQSMQAMKVHPMEMAGLDISALNEIYSTGSPLSAESFDFVYAKIKRDVRLSSITGGTDILSLFAGHCPLIPVVRGEIQCRCLGMAVEVWSPDGHRVADGESGDLVCVKPFPSMPVGFWNDPEYKLYKQTYFSNYQYVWYHGDYMQLQPKSHGVVMLGRSDGTLKPAGVRFGSAELYHVVETYFADSIVDSLAVGQRRKGDDDERVLLFCKMVEDREMTAELVGKIKAKIRDALSPRHVPAVVVATPAIPYTINGKKVEVLVKRLVSGEEVKPSATLANPECLGFYKEFK